MNSTDLYQESIKRFAREAYGQGRLDAASAEVRLDNPLCGDRITLQVLIDGGRIAGVAHQTRGCLLCRAAAAVVGLRAAGEDPARIQINALALEHLLQHGTAVPDAWPELAMFAPAGAHVSRHRCVLLPFRALLAALAAASGNKPESDSS